MTFDYYTSVTMSKFSLLWYNSYCYVCSVLCILFSLRCSVYCLSKCVQCPSSHCYVTILVVTFRSVYSVSLRCSVYCLSKCVLYYCNLVSKQLQLSCHIKSYHIISYQSSNLQKIAIIIFVQKKYKTVTKSTAC